MIALRFCIEGRLNSNCHRTEKRKMELTEDRTCILSGAIKYHVYFRYKDVWTLGYGSNDSSTSTENLAGSVFAVVLRVKWSSEIIVYVRIITNVDFYRIVIIKCFVFRIIYSIEVPLNHRTPSARKIMKGLYSYCNKYYFLGKLNKIYPVWTRC